MKVACFVLFTTVMFIINFTSSDAKIAGQFHTAKGDECKYMEGSTSGLGRALVLNCHCTVHGGGGGSSSEHGKGGHHHGLAEIEGKNKGKSVAHHGSGKGSGSKEGGKGGKGEEKKEESGPKTYHYNCQYKGNPHNSAKYNKNQEGFYAAAANVLSHEPHACDLHELEVPKFDVTLTHEGGTTPNECKTTSLKMLLMKFLKMLKSK